MKIYVETAETKLPTMLMPSELAFCKFAAEQTSGDVYELGPWLGSSTVALLSGMDCSRRLTSIDMFEWAEYMRALSGIADIKIGSSFVERYLANVRGHSESHSVKMADICDTVPTGPIGLLFIDAFKASRTTEHVFTKYFPFVDVGGWIVDQDFLWDVDQRVYYHLWFAQLVRAGFIEPIYRCVPGALVAFRVLRKINDNAVQSIVKARPSARDLVNLVDDFSARGIYQ